MKIKIPPNTTPIPRCPPRDWPIKHGPIKPPIPRCPPRDWPVKHGPIKAIPVPHCPPVPSPVKIARPYLGPLRGDGFDPK